MGINKRSTWPALLCLLVTLPAVAAEPDPIALLKSSLEEPEVSYQGRVMVTRWFGKQTRAEEVTVFYAPSNRYRWEFLAPDGSVKRVVVSDGAHEELRLADKTLRGDALKSTSKLISEDKERELLLKNYSVSLRGKDEVAGRRVWVIELDPTAKGKPHQRLWIDAETHVVLENKRFYPNRPFAALSRFSRFEPNKALSDDLFALSADSGVQVDPYGLDPDFFSLEELDRALGKPSKFPPSLPGDFVFESADFFNVQSRTVRHIRYTDGLVVLSLFQTDRPVRLSGAAVPESLPTDAPPGSLRLSSSGKVLHWKQGRNYYTVVGDVSMELLERVAAYLKHPSN